MEMLRQAILQALEDKYQAQISEADATIKIYLDNSVGIGEHPQHLEEIDKLLQKINKPFARKIQILTVGEQRAKVMGKSKVAAIFKKGKDAIRRTNNNR
jgi:hypothetical protein